jgi:hypothetical protein
LTLGSCGIGSSLSSSSGISCGLVGGIDGGLISRGNCSVGCGSCGVSDSLESQNGGLEQFGDHLFFFFILNNYNIPDESVVLSDLFYNHAAYLCLSIIL